MKSRYFTPFLFLALAGCSSTQTVQIQPTAAPVKVAAAPKPPRPIEVIQSSEPAPPSMFGSTKSRESAIVRDSSGKAFFLSPDDFNSKGGLTQNEIRYAKQLLKTAESMMAALEQVRAHMRKPESDEFEAAANQLGAVLEDAKSFKNTPKKLVPLNRKMTQALSELHKGTLALQGKGGARSMTESWEAAVTHLQNGSQLLEEVMSMLNQPFN